MSQAMVKRHIRRARDLRGNRSAWHNHWDDLAHVMLPRRLGFASMPLDGDRRTDDLFDSSPMQAARGLANAVGGLLRPQGRKWARIRLTEDELENLDEVKEWMERADEAITNAFSEPSSRFLQGSAEADLDLVVFGTAVLFVGETENLTSLLFQSVPLKEAVVFFDDDGNARGIYRDHKMTLGQAEEKWGRDALSEKSRRALASNRFDEKIEFLHAVVPRETGRDDATLSRNFPWTDLWIEVAEEHVVLEKGFRDFPFVVPRWDTSSGETYGRSPGMIALPDACTLQAMGETMLVAGQRAADPPLAVPADGIVSEVNTFPGGLSYYDPTNFDGRNPFFPIMNGANMPLTRDMQRDYRDQVFAAFFRNVLNLPIEGPQMTATEVNQRKEEFIREIGPVFGRLETDYTAPMVQRAFKVMMRTGRLPDLPRILEGHAIRFEYESPVKRVREQIEASAARLWVREMVEYSGATGDVSVLDNINTDQYAKFSARAAGIPGDMVNSRSAVDQIRQTREQAQLQAIQMQALGETVDIAGTAARAADAAGLFAAAK